MKGKEIVSIETKTIKIGKLLAAAEGASTEEEANAFFAKAQQIATLHSIELAMARQNVADPKRQEEPTHRRVHIGARRQHKNSNLIRLYSAVAYAQDVRINIAHDSTYVNAFGFPSDMDAVEQLWSSIGVQMVRFSEEYLARDEWRQETSYRGKRVPDRWGGTYEEFGLWPITKQSARHTFQTSFIAKIGMRLKEAVATEVKDAEDHFHQDDVVASDAPVESSSVAVALRDKKDAVDRHYQQHSTARGSWRGGGGSGYSDSAASAGRSAGARASLGRSAGIGGGAKAVSA